MGGGDRAGQEGGAGSGVEQRERTVVCERLRVVLASAAEGASRRSLQARHVASTQFPRRLSEHQRVRRGIVRGSLMRWARGCAREGSSGVRAEAAFHSRFRVRRLVTTRRPPASTTRRPRTPTTRPTTGLRTTTGAAPATSGTTSTPATGKRFHRGSVESFTAVARRRGAVACRGVGGFVVAVWHHGMISRTRRACDDVSCCIFLYCKLGRGGAWSFQVV